MPKLPSAIKDHDLNMFEVQQKIFFKAHSWKNEQMG